MNVATLSDYAQVGLWLLDKTVFLLAGKLMGNHCWKR